jgi:formylglycine-generating enzyme required for sulfatase activity/serine/threonine protein kinase
MSTRLVQGDVVGGDFEIVRLLGEGGMGSVYEVRQRSTGALRALKTMLPELARDEGFRNRFAQEAQVITKVESEHVVLVLSAGIDTNHGVPWIAMEMLKGEDLATRLERTAPLDYDTTREIFAQIGHAFVAAHAAGIVHRDLKPENVFVCEARTSTRSVTIKVLDFGIAKVLTGSIATTTKAMGSPLWMAPEQTIHDGAIAPATDVWAIGLLAFYALTGKFYWQAANGAGGTAITLMREITLDPLEPASSRSKRYGGATLPPEFDAWFARCIDREPGNRFKDASEAIPALLALLASAPKREGRAIELAVTDTAILPATGGGNAKPEATGPGGTQLLTPSEAPLITSNGTDMGFANTNARSPADRATAPVPGATSRRLLAFGAIAAALAAVGGGSFLYARTKHPHATTSSLPPSTSAMPSASAGASAGSAPDASRVDQADVARARSAKMITIPGQTFTVGNAKGIADESPLQVSVAAFEMDVSEVSTFAYLTCVEAGACRPTATLPGCNASDPTKRDHPINCVAYVDAKAYCEWVDKRLPSETEWELAARGKKGRRYPWGSAPPATQLCWQRAPSDKAPLGTCALGGFPAGNTPEGLEDMAGNVWEWTTSRYCPYAHPNCTDERRVARGGSWASGSPDLVAPTVRNEAFETDRAASMGFRCARAL